MSKKTMITISSEINAPIETVWKFWNNPKDIQQWNNINENWHNPVVENDLRPGGQFLYVMATKDGSHSFNFTGIYDEVKEHELITYTLDSGRTASIQFTAGNPVILTEIFEPGDEPSVEEQRDFCQAIHDSFKNYVEARIR